MFSLSLHAIVCQLAPSPCPLAAAGDPWPPVEDPWPPAEAPSAQSASRTSMAFPSTTRQTALQTTGSTCALTSFPSRRSPRTCPMLMPWDTPVSISSAGPWTRRSPWRRCRRGPPCHPCLLQARLWTPRFSLRHGILHWLRCQRGLRRLRAWEPWKCSGLRPQPWVTMMHKARAHLRRLLTLWTMKGCEKWDHT